MIVYLILSHRSQKVCFLFFPPNSLSFCSWDWSIQGWTTNGAFIQMASDINPKPAWWQEKLATASHTWRQPGPLGSGEENEVILLLLTEKDHLISVDSPRVWWPPKQTCKRAALPTLKVELQEHPRVPVLSSAFPTARWLGRPLA